MWLFNLILHISGFCSLKNKSNRVCDYAFIVYDTNIPVVHCTLLRVFVLTFPKSKYVINIVNQFEINTSGLYSIGKVVIFVNLTLVT